MKKFAKIFDISSTSISVSHLSIMIICLSASLYYSSFIPVILMVLDYILIFVFSRFSNLKSTRNVYNTLKIFNMYCILIGVFVLLTTSVIENSIPSSATNDAWLGYFGSIFGASIGAAVAGISLATTLKENRIVRQQDKIDKVKPYLYIKKCRIYHTEKEEITTICYIAFEIINLGLGTSFDINMKHNNRNNEENEDVELINNLSEQASSVHMIQEKLTLKINSKLKNISAIEQFEITYYDVHRNQYKQTVEMNFINESSICSPPELIKFNKPK